MDGRSRFHQARRFLPWQAPEWFRSRWTTKSCDSRSPGETAENHPYNAFASISCRHGNEIERRTSLLDFARAHDAFVFEDDFYAEFRFTGPPLPCLQGIDDFGRVIYAGTMSKILFPSLRLGYVVAPEALIDPFVKIRSTMDQHSSAIDQATLARFITEDFSSVISNE